LKASLNNSPNPKPKNSTAALSRWGASPEEKILLILTEIPENVYLSGRNICNLKIIRADSLNVYDVILADRSYRHRRQP
jgi:large subunit ribosomal protein L4